MKTLLTATSIAAMLALTPAMAQETAPAPSTDMTTPASPDTGSDMNKTMPEMAPADSAQMPSATDSTKTMADAGKSDQMFFADQQPGEVLSSEIVGETIYNASDENIGEVSDFVTDGQGQIKALVVSVGGFLGIGAKEVAVNYDKFTVIASGENESKVTLDTTKDALEKAPEFKTLAMKAAEKPLPATGMDTTTQPATQ
ncbi:PRC-barrel domain protein [Hartmannibacter diazotrophicus]|uniref:PRC-barrel domain protein n=1 Tax=Hartmannibacter diazotrophicus TaxID=1482074 RepID=A0A2C9D8C8_9HYPH|nr:PRC-barrel domain-containing protein [Hartmannibacter diazotrophicus]SON56430.1 PRC-barrel domain protein [Hartmannibacter diazotrophicus]